LAVNRYYSATAQDTTVASAFNGSATNIVVNGLTGYPSNTPFIVAVDYNTSSEELVQVNAYTGTGPYTLSVTRGFNSTSPTNHAIGAVVRHVISAQDMTEAQQHIAATTGIHGVAGSLASKDDMTSISFMTMGA